MYHIEGNQSWIFLERIDVEAEAPRFWPPDVKNWLIGKKIPDAGKDKKQEKETTKEEMVGWHHQLDRHEFEQALGVGGGQGRLACCSPWGHRIRQDWGLNLPEIKSPPFSCPWLFSLTLDMGYLFTAAPAKHSRCFLCYTWDISTRPLLLTLDVGYLLLGARHSSAAQPHKVRETPVRQ